MVTLTIQEDIRYQVDIAMAEPTPMSPKRKMHRELIPVMRRPSGDWESQRRFLFLVQQVEGERVLSEKKAGEWFTKGLQKILKARRGPKKLCASKMGVSLISKVISLQRRESEERPDENP